MKPTHLRTVHLSTPTRHDLPTLTKRYQTAVNPERLGKLADGLGLSVESLNRLRIGWASDHRAWSFPMSDTSGAVRGIRLRLESGRKFSVTGGREGLFVPDDLPEGRLFITEGPTDCAALLDMGLAAVGRPSCTGAVKLLADLVRLRGADDLVIVADADDAGKRGAEALASVLALHCLAVRIICPPDGVKDARAWRISGATAADLLAVVNAAPVLKLSVAVRAGRGPH